MKYIILFIVLFSVNANACLNKIPLSEARKAVALEPNAGSKPCDGSEPCLCFDGVDFEVVDLVGDKFISNPAKALAKSTRLQADAQAKAAEALAIQQAMDRLAEVTKKPTMTTLELTLAVKDLYKLLAK